jgi:hypothetical protein
MCKTFMLTVVAGLSAVMLAAAQSPKKPFVVVKSDPVKLAGSVEEMFGDSAVVIRGRVLLSQVANRETALPIPDVVTKHTVIIEDIIKDERNELKAGDTIEVLEHGGDFDAGDKVIHSAKRTQQEINPGKEVLMFLSKGPLGFGLVDSAFGSFNVGDDGIVEQSRLPDAKRSKKDFIDYLQSLNGKKR